MARHAALKASDVGRTIVLSPGGGRVVTFPAPQPRSYWSEAEVIRHQEWRLRLEAQRVEAREWLHRLLDDTCRDLGYPVQAWRAVRVPVVCPWPGKEAHPDEATARARHATLLGMRPTLRIYQCPTGHWHAGNVTGGERLSALLPAETVARLRKHSMAGWRWRPGLEPRHEKRP